MDINAIRNLLPHRYPFLLVDRVVEFNAGQSLVAIKNVSINEPFFQGHFPEKPVMPGVLILEALAQATGLLAFKTGTTTGNPARSTTWSAWTGRVSSDPSNPVTSYACRSRLSRSNAVSGCSTVWRVWTARP